MQGPLIASLPAEREALELAGQLRDARLTVLCGGSDAARRHFIDRGLLPLLRRRSRDRTLVGSGASAADAASQDRRRCASHETGALAEVVTVLDDWNDCPVTTLQKRLHESIASAGVGATSLSMPMAKSLAAWSRVLDARFLIILARFDEFLQMPAECGDRRRFTQELNQILCEPGLPVNFLICMRETEAAGGRWSFDPIVGLDVASRIRLPDGRSSRPRTLSDLTLREMLEPPDVPFFLLRRVAGPAVERVSGRIRRRRAGKSRLRHAAVASATIAALACACWIARGADSQWDKRPHITVSSSGNMRPN